MLLISASTLGMTEGNSGFMSCSEVGVFQNFIFCHCM